MMLSLSLMMSLMPPVSSTIVFGTMAVLLLSLLLLWQLHWRRNNIPGPLALIPGAHTFALLRDINQFAKKNHQRFGDIFQAAIGAEILVFVHGEANVKQTLVKGSKSLHLHWPVQYDHIVSRTIMSKQDSEHTMLKRVIGKCFAPSALELYWPRMQELTTSYVQRLAASHVEIYQQTREFFWKVNVSSLLGLDVNKNENHKQLSEELKHCMKVLNAEAASLPMFIPCVRSRQGLKARRRAEEIITDLITSDALDKCSCAGLLMKELQNEAQSEITLEDIIGNLFGLLWAGFDTRSSATVVVLTTIAQYPLVQERIVEEFETAFGPANEHGKAPSVSEISKLPYMEAVIMEALLHVPIIDFALRLVVKPLTVGKHLLPRNTLIVAGLSSKTLDLSEFNPERFLHNPPPKFSFLPFGAGNRSCIGVNMAKSDMKLVLYTVLRSYRVNLQGDKPKFVLNIDDNMVPWPENGAYLSLTPRDERSFNVAA